MLLSKMKKSLENPEQPSANAQKGELYEVEEILEKVINLLVRSPLRMAIFT